MRATKLKGVMAMDIGALVRLCSAYFLSAPPQQLPAACRSESDHGEHLLS
jgi:hypothetical protein